MESIHYSAAWTDSGFLLGCSHEHETIVEADSCIPCAGGYVVGVENGVMRSLTAEEEGEFQRVHYAPRTDNPAAPELVINAPRESIPPRSEGETFVEFVLRLLDVGKDIEAESSLKSHKGKREARGEIARWGVARHHHKKRNMHLQN